MSDEWHPYDPQKEEREALVRSTMQQVRYEQQLADANRKAEEFYTTVNPAHKDLLAKDWGYALVQREGRAYLAEHPEYQTGYAQGQDAGSSQGDRGPRGS